MRNRAFTLVEVMVVVALIATLAAVVIPRYAAAEAGQASRDFTSGLMRIGADARLLSIRSGEAVEVSYDDSRRVLVFSTVDTESLATNESSTIALPASVALSNFTLDGAFVDGSSWIARFYPDGSGPDAGIEVEDNGYVYHVTIEGRDGTAVKRDGPLEEVGQQEWQAGELETRV